MGSQRGADSSDGLSERVLGDAVSEEFEAGVVVWDSSVELERAENDGLEGLRITAPR